MNIKSLFRLAGSIIFLSLFSSGSMGAPGQCKGPNKNDPDCNDPPQPIASTVNSATIDWQNQQIVVRGENLDSVTTFTLGGSTAITPLNVAPSEVNLPFDTAVADAVVTKGNYQLNTDGADVLSLFVKSQIIATDATGCPCESSWNTVIGGQQAPECLEILGPEELDTADIAGTVYSDPGNDPTVYPQYPFGAAFIPSDPVTSVCRLVQINGDGTSSELANYRINEIQQKECAIILENNYCAIITRIP